jgi:hypothetical protein
MLTRVVGFVVSDALAAELALPLRAMSEMTRRDAVTFTAEAWAFHDACIIAARGRPDAELDASPDAEDPCGTVSTRGKQVVGLRRAAAIRGCSFQALHEQCIKGKFPHRKDASGRYIFQLENLEEAAG